MYWYARPLGIVPLFAISFLLIIGVLFLIPEQELAYMSRADLKLYALMGACLFILSRQVSLVYVTSHGIVKNLINPKQTIPWFQVVDYLKQTQDKACRYVFIYEHEPGSLKPLRLNLDVPLRKEIEFQKWVDQHLD
jgi:hypothetical protein